MDAVLRDFVRNGDMVLLGRRNVHHLFLQILRLHGLVLLTGAYVHIVIALYFLAGDVCVLEFESLALTMDLLYV